MKTSNYRKYRGSKGVSISIYPPNNYLGESFPSLAPDRETFFLKKSNLISEEEYERRYRGRTLSKLNPQTVYKMFIDKVLLCWEEPGEFCHRRIVAKWIEEETGFEVPEWNGEDEKSNLNIELF